jgi:hypothetical protein
MSFQDGFCVHLTYTHHVLNVFLFSGGTRHFSFPIPKISHFFKMSGPLTEEENLDEKIRAFNLFIALKALSLVGLTN